jgi:KUP system potassium uptake protein
VLSAVEGLEVVQPELSGIVVPIAVVILIGVFALQRFGTNVIGRLFGPIMLLGFLVLAVTGVASILHEPTVLQVLSPHWVVLFFIEQPRTAFFALGAIVLAVTGAEALYADLGHFGRPAITRAWLWVVFPSLVLNYLGQASLALRHPADAATSFFGLVPSWGQLPMVILATVATIIASQAVISGTYSVIHQAWRLGLFPPLRVVHTSSESEGQIYVPAINVFLAGVSGGQPSQGCIRRVASTRNRKRRLRRHGHMVGRPTSNPARPATGRDAVERVAKPSDRYQGCSLSRSRGRCIHRQEPHYRADRAYFDGDPKFGAA